MNYECIKTYVAGQHWDEQLGQNVQYKRRAYATDDAKPTPPAYETAADELDRLARQRMTLFPVESYRQAFNFVLADHPELKAAYGGVK